MSGQPQPYSNEMGNLNPTIVDNLKRSFKAEHGRYPNLSDEQVWDAFEWGYFMENAEEEYVSYMKETEGKQDA